MKRSSGLREEGFSALEVERRKSRQRKFAYQVVVLPEQKFCFLILGGEKEHWLGGKKRLKSSQTSHATLQGWFEGLFRYQDRLTYSKRQTSAWTGVSSGVWYSTLSPPGVESNNALEPEDAQHQRSSNVIKWHLQSFTVFLKHLNICFCLIGALLHCQIGHRTRLPQEGSGTSEETLLHVRELCVCWVWIYWDTVKSHP